MHSDPQSEDDVVPYGTCHCGCGSQTALITRTDSSRGSVKGQQRRYVRGHHRRKPVRYVEVPTGYLTDCWIWQLAKDGAGYGMCWDAPGGRMVRAHRLYYEHEHGPIPEDLQCDHLCRQPTCVRPDHMEPVTPAENVRRGRATKLTPDAVYEIRRSTEKQVVLARRYGVGQGHISRIKNNQTWRDAKSGGFAQLSVDLLDVAGAE